MKPQNIQFLKVIFSFFILSQFTSSCIVRKWSSFNDLYPMFTGLWILFLVLSLASGGYYIFGKDDSKRFNAGKASIICLILFVALLTTA